MPVNLRRSLVMTVMTIAVTFVFAFVGVGVSQLFFKHQADGSITAMGSTLIGQNWADAPCGSHPLGSCVFHGRPDDTGPYAAVPKKDIAGGDNPLVACQTLAGSKEPVCVNGESAATNFGPRSKVLLEDTDALIAYWHTLGVDPTEDLVTTSGSGYDPDVTAPDALVQVPMVANATGIAPAVLRRLIASENNSAQLGFLGSSYIDVLQLNDALERLH